MARIKPKPVIAANLDDARRMVAEIGALKREVELIEAAMQEKIDDARTIAAQSAKPLQERHKILWDAVEAFATLNKKKFFTENRRLDLGPGVIGFRLSTIISQARDITEEMTIEKMRKLKFVDGIRAKESVNKKTCSGWPDERLASVGLERQQKYTFFIDVNKEETGKDCQK